MQVAAPVTFTKDTPALLRPLPGNTQRSKETDIHTTAQWIKLRQSWPKFKFFDSDETLKNLREGQKKVPRKRKCMFYDGLVRFVPGTGT
jgi:hypothetical protein